MAILTCGLYKPISPEPRLQCWSCCRRPSPQILAFVFAKPLCKYVFTATQPCVYYIAQTPVDPCAANMSHQNRPNIKSLHRNVYYKPRQLSIRVCREHAHTRAKSYTWPGGNDAVCVLPLFCCGWCHALVTRSEIGRYAVPLLLTCAVHLHTVVRDKRLAQRNP